MRRKIIKQGLSSLTISLPTTWTKKFNLKPGDEIEVIDKGKELLIQTERIFTSKKTLMDVSGLNKSMIRNYINAAYIRGDDELKITFNDHDLMDVIQECIDFNIGFAVVEQCRNYCVIKDLSGTSASEFDNMLKRVFYMIMSFGDEGLEMLKKKEPLKDFWKRDLSIDKYIFYCLRVLNKKGHPDFEKTSLYHNTLLLLEHLSDEYNRLYRYLKNPSLCSGTIKMFEDVNQMFKDFFKLFYKFDKNKAQELLQEKRRIREGSFQTKNQNEMVVIYYLRKIVEMIINILQIEMQMVL
ncbi:MAG: hypothetical protein ABIC91_01985 [Nanoarchaeota archaeon]|nr:hypothetical protein [Nanoarchaeota archaeon]MBU1030653.1 hypothetical protein [Nanoarchaeota archaeon]